MEECFTDDKAMNIALMVRKTIYVFEKLLSWQCLEQAFKVTRK